MSGIPPKSGPLTLLKRPYSHARNWLNTRLGIDKAIAFTVLARGWASLAGMLTVALIARFLSPAEQGYYYTFGSLIALQIVFELGFSFVILQMASHERSHLTFHPDGGISGSATAHARLASVLQKSIRWYSAAAVLMGSFLICAGSYFFSSHQQAGDSTSWRFPWYATSLAAAIAFQLDPILSFMEGCGFVSNVARLRFIQAAIGSILAWWSIATHHGLFAPAAMITGNAAVSLIWISRHRRLLTPLLQHNPREHRIRWVKEVWPFQWRIAVSWLCGYFIFQLFNPVLFAYKGAVVAGQMGMSLSIANALQSVSISWINTKAAPLGGLIAKKEFAALDALFFRAFKQSLGVCSIGALCVWLAAVYLNWKHFHFAQRLLSPASLGMILLSTIVNVAVFSEALYLRAHKQEKFLLNSVLGGLLTVCSTYFLGRRFGPIGMAAGSLSIGLAMALPLGTYTFLKYRRIWHEA